MHARFLFFLSFLTLSLLDWLYSLFRPDMNAPYWLAAGAGAFVIRFALPKLPAKSSFFGWLVGVIIACLFAPSFVKTQLFGPLEPVAVWGVTALIGDLLIQLIGWFVRLTQKLGNYTYEHPDQAFDNTLEKAEKLTGVWVRIKTPLLDLVQSAISIFTRKS